VLEIGGSLPRDFVIGDLKAEQWIALEEMDYYNDISNPFDKSNIIELDAVENASDLGDYAVVSGRAEKLTPAFYEKFDVICSIAAFEHIDRMPIALSRMYHSLKPGGRLFTMFSPIWSSRDGHHLHGVTDKKGNTFSFANSPIPPWGHLLMRPPQMYNHLLSYTDEEAAAEIVFNVYNSSAINRLFTEEYVKYFEMSPFEIETLVATFSNPPPEDIQQRLEVLYPERKRFDNAGLLVVLTRSLAA
jgi:SAM-dependent methyltransferase